MTHMKCRWNCVLVISFYSVKMERSEVYCILELLPDRNLQFPGRAVIKLRNLWPNPIFP